AVIWTPLGGGVVVTVRVSGADVASGVLWPLGVNRAVSVCVPSVAKVVVSCALPSTTEMPLPITVEPVKKSTVPFGLVAPVNVADRVTFVLTCTVVADAPRFTTRADVGLTLSV